MLTTADIVKAIGLGYVMGLVCWSLGAVYDAVRGAVRTVGTE